MHIKIRHDLLLTCFAVTLLIFQGFAQTGTHSPYSYYGIGTMVNPATISSLSMGGTGVAIRDARTVNFQNPASYTAFDTTSFVFEGGFYTEIMNLETDEFSERSVNSSLYQLLFGFPLTRWWKTAAGLLPYSRSGYHIIREEVDPQIGTLRYQYEGSGGLHRLFLGNAVSLGKNLSAGINVNYLFGNLEKSQMVSFPDSSYIFSSKTLEDMLIQGFLFDYGIQYTIPLKKSMKLNLGAVYSGKPGIPVKKEELIYTLADAYNEVEDVRDTILFNDKVKGTLSLPAGIGGGMVLSKENSWLIGADFMWYDWSSFRLYDRSDSLRDSYRIRVGAQYIPDKTGGLKFWKRSAYRLGLNYAKSPLYLKGRQPDEFGITFGIGLPVLKNESMLNIGVEIGQRGTKADNLIRENYFNLSLGISLYEWWFYKRKYQ